MSWKRVAARICADSTIWAKTLAHQLCRSEAHIYQYTSTAQGEGIRGMKKGGLQQGLKRDEKGMK